MQTGWKRETAAPMKHTEKLSVKRTSASQSLERRSVKYVCCMNSTNSCMNTLRHTNDTVNDCLQCETWQKHKNSALQSRLAYQTDAEKDCVGDTSVRSVDLHKVIMLPRMPGVKTAVFTQRIVAYHKTFASVGKKAD